MVKLTPPKYPVDAILSGLQALVIVRAVIGTDGFPRDPEVIIAAQSSVPPPPDRRSHASYGEARSFADAVTRSVIERRYEPARMQGEVVAVNYTFRITFRMGDASELLKEGIEEQLRAAASDGDPAAQFASAVLGLDGGSSTDAHGPILKAAQAGLRRHS